MGKLPLSVGFTLHSLTSYIGWQHIRLVRRPCHCTLCRLRSQLDRLHGCPIPHARHRKFASTHIQEPHSLRRHRIQLRHWCHNASYCLLHRRMASSHQRHHSHPLRSPDHPHGRRHGLRLHRSWRNRSTYWLVQPSRHHRFLHHVRRSRLADYPARRLQHWQVPSHCGVWLRIGHVYAARYVLDLSSRPRSTNSSPQATWLSKPSSP